MTIRTDSPEATRAVAAALGEKLVAGDLVLLVGDLGAGKTAFAQGLAKGLGVDEPVTSPTFTIVQQYEGRLRLAHVDVYRLDRVQELYDLGFDEMVDADGVTVVEWGDLVAQALPTEHLLVRIDLGDADTERVLDLSYFGARWRERREELEHAFAIGARLMLVLGIETATRRVGVVLASENGMVAHVELGGYSDDGQPRHAEQLAPAIEFCCNQVGTSLDHVSAVAVGVGPGMFTGLRVGVTTAKVLAQALRIPMIPVPSLDLLAYPLRHTRALVVDAIDARRNELYYALYRTVQGGVQHASDYEIGTPDDLVAELEARGEEALLCGDGALRFSNVFRDVERAELAGPAHAAPSLAALSELAIARYQREEFSAADDVLPLYLRKSDAELAWDRKER